MHANAEFLRNPPRPDAKVFGAFEHARHARPAMLEIDEAGADGELVFLRVLRVEVDVKLAIGLFTIDQAAEYLEKIVLAGN